MRGTIGFWLAFLVPTVSAAADPPPSIDPVWRERVRTEGRAAFEKYVEAAKRLDVLAEMRYDKKPGASVGVGKAPYRPQTMREWTVRLDDNMIRERIRIRDGDTDPPQPYLDCDNVNYYFRLQKRPNGYALVEYELGQRKPPLKDQGGGMHEYAHSSWLRALKAVDDVDKHTLRVIRWDESRKLLRIAYTAPVGDETANNEILVDPEHEWRVVESRGETKNGGFTDVVSYGIPILGLEFPTGFRSVSTYKVEQGPPDLEITGRVISLKVTDKRPEDFRLSAFGLPEPVDAPPLPKHTPLYVWFLAGAAVLGLLAIGFRYLARQRAPSAPASSPV
jgi:hypothetical protein